MAPILPVKEEEHYETHPLAGGWSLTRLRDALHSGDASALNAAATPFYDVCCGPLLRYCDSLLRRAMAAGVAPALDGADLAMEAYQRTLQLLRGEGGKRIRDESHLIRVLYRSARYACADALRLPDTRYSRPQSDGMTTGRGSDGAESDSAHVRSPEESLLESGSAAVAAISFLFSDGEGFARMMRESDASLRHYRQYRALALYEIGDRLRDDLIITGGKMTTTSGGEAALRLWQRFVKELFALPAEDWTIVEQGAIKSVTETVEEEGGLYPSLRDAVNAVCGTNLRDRAKLSVLRHEMGKLLQRRGTELWERGNFG